MKRGATSVVYSTTECEFNTSAEDVQFVDMKHEEVEVLLLEGAVLEGAALLLGGVLVVCWGEQCWRTCWSGGVWLGRVKYEVLGGKNSRERALKFNPAHH